MTNKNTKPIEEVTPVEDEETVITDTSKSVEGENKVLVPRDTLTSILHKQEEMEGQMTKLKEQNKKLEFASDRKRLNQYDEKNNDGELIRTANIGVWEGKYILGWETVKNEVRVVDGKLIENQITKIFLDEGEGKKPSSLELDYGYWYENISRANGSILSRNEKIDKETRKKTVTFSIEMEDGRTLNISPTFINL